MQGGLFGLSLTQKIYLYLSCIAPTLIALAYNDISKMLFSMQLFYVGAIVCYIRYFSLQKSLYPYLSNELNKVRSQLQKGSALGLSAFLLLTVYGIVLLRWSKLVLPSNIPLTAHWGAASLLLLLNPCIEELFWRLFLPKTFHTAYDKAEVLHATYLLYHFAIFSSFLGVWRAIPFVGTFFSVGKSMSHIRIKHGILAAIITHYGITAAGSTLLLYIQLYHNISI